MTAQQDASQRCASGLAAARAAAAAASAAASTAAPAAPGDSPPFSHCAHHLSLPVYGHGPEQCNLSAKKQKRQQLAVCLPMPVVICR